MPRSRLTRRALIAVATTALLAAWLLGGGLPAALLQALAYLLPLLAALATRRYPGERALLEAIASRRGHRGRVSPARSARSHPRVLVARGGRLIACSLAERPPPGPTAVLL